MVLPSALVRLRSRLRRRPLLGNAQSAAAKLYRRLVPRGEVPHPFDREHGVDTGGALQAALDAKRLRSGHAHDRHTAGYFGSQPSVFRAAMGLWLTMLAEDGHTPEDTLESFTFIDIGCGKGRILMLASEFAFRRIVGIELHPGLAATARSNLRCWSRLPHLCQDISVLRTDVLDFALPNTPALLYLYHPFEGELFEAWTRTLMAATRTRTAPLYLAYTNPVHEAHLHCLPGVVRLWAGDLPFSAEDAAAHLFGGTFERFSLYRLTAPVSAAQPQIPEKPADVSESGFRTVPGRAII